MNNKVWNYISNPGTSSADNVLNSRTIILTNQLNFLMGMSMSLLLVITAFLYIIIQYPVSTGTLRVAIVLLFNILLMALSRAGFVKISWLLLIFITPVVFMIGPTVSGYVEQENFIYYPYVVISASIIPQLLINPQKQRFLYIIALGYYFILTVFIYDLLKYFSKDDFEIVRIIQNEFREFYTIVQIVVFIFINAGIYYLIKLNYRFEAELEQKNTELDRQNSELKKQKAEIEQGKEELRVSEILTWQKMVNIISHEIVNSAIPITNLAGMSRQILEDESGEVIKASRLHDDITTDVHHSLKIIETRTQALINLVNATKSLSHIPLPVKRCFPVSDLIDRVSMLYKSKITEYGITLEKSVTPSDLCIEADLELVEQVIINLIKNSLEAMKGIKEPRIRITASTDQSGKLRISVADNGTGIKKEISEKIFLPYFSTKQGNSGIGLSLSRQIMMLHNGSLEVVSEQDKGAVFTLVF